MLGRSWGFSVIMEESRRSKAAEYLEETQGAGGSAWEQHRGLPGSRVALPSPSPGCGGYGDGALHCQSHAVTLLEDGVVGALPKHHAVQHAA